MRLQEEGLFVQHSIPGDVEVLHLQGPCKAPDKYISTFSQASSTTLRNITVSERYGQLPEALLSFVHEALLLWFGMCKQLMMEAEWEQAKRVNHLPSHSP